MKLGTPKYNRKTIQVTQSLADLTKGIEGTSYAKFFDGAASFENSAITHINIDAIPVEDRAKVVPTLIEFLAVRAEKRRRKVRFLPAQVIRKIRLRLHGITPIECDYAALRLNDEEVARIKAA